MPERAMPSQESVKTPEKSLRGKVSPAAVWVASGMIDRNAGKRKIDSVDTAVNSLASRKPEDLSSHHEKVAAFSTKQREMHWLERQTQDPRLQNSDEQIMQWQDGVLDYLSNLQEKGKYEHWHSALETLGVDQQEAVGAKDFSSVVRDKIEDFRQKFLRGPAKIDAFAAYFTKGRSLEENLKALDNAEGFLGVFGGKETVELIKDAIIAHAFVQNLQGERKDELLEAAKEAFDSELPEETARLYGLLYEKPQEMNAGEEHNLAVPLTESSKQMEPAPVEEDVQGGLVNSSEHTQGEEAESLGATPETEEKALTYPEFQKAVMDKELLRYPELATWFGTESAKLPEMQVEVGEVPVTNGQDWNAEFVKNESGEVEGVQAITNTKKFFSLEGVKITRGDRSWTQPGLLEDTAQVEIETAYGKVALQTSGFVGVVKDNQGNILVGLGQEPLSDTPNHVVVKDPLQTSIGKFLLVMGDPSKGIPGEPTQDKAFYDTLAMVFPGENPFQQFLDHLKKPDTIWAMGAVNGNRLRSSNISFEIVVDDAQKEALTLNGANRWVTEDERKALQRAGLLNLIGTGAFTAV